MINKKNSVHIRVKPEDKKVWREYCKLLGEPSQKLFSKVMRSDNIKLDKKILQEHLKREEELRRRLRFR